MSGADCTPAPDVTHRHIRGVLGLHCVGGRAGTGGGVPGAVRIFRGKCTNKKIDGGYACGASATGSTCCRASVGDHAYIKILTMKYTRLITAIAISCLCGCASNPPVQPVANSKSQFEGAVFGGDTSELGKPTQGAEVYRAFYQGGSGFVSVSSVRETVEEMAAKHCARQGMTARLLQETTSKPPHVLGNFPRVEMLFECAGAVPAASSKKLAGDKLGQIERLKKLLDSGALTQQEYEREKTKILGLE